MGQSNPFNTESTPYHAPASVSFTLDFINDPISRESLGLAPYDVFMLIDNASLDGKEVHLIGFEP
jgi:LruC domain-containing protein